MIGNRWNLLQKHCLFIPVQCTSNLPQPQETARVLNTRVIAVFSLWEQHSVLCCPLDCQIWRLQISFFGATWRRQCIEKKISQPRSLERTHSIGDYQNREWCSVAKGGQRAMSCWWVSCGVQWPFPTHDMKSSSSPWIHVCTTLVYFHSVHALQNYRP
jgi:hypothetical protein